MTQYTSSGQNNGNVPPKTFAPYVPPSKSYQPFTPVSIAVISPPNYDKIESKAQQHKNTKFYNGTSLSPINGNGTNSGNIKNENFGYKTVPSFLENRNVMKGSMITTQQELIGKQLKSDSSQGQLGIPQIDTNQNFKKFRSVGQQMDMKFSSIQFSTQGAKVPAFIQQKKKIPYIYNSERPESSKDINNTKLSTLELSNSYGNLKKLKFNKEQQITKQNDTKDPTIDWIKSSWNKKKQKIVGINDFQKIKQLGSGKYGKVFLARQKLTNFICALKILQKNLIKQQEITQQIIRELKIQSFLNHKNLIKMHGFFDDAINIYLIMQVATGGQLFKQIKKHQSMPQLKVAGIMRQVCNAVNQLHSNRIIHRDIKPQNIVMHENVLKLCDFGWSVYCDSNLRTTFCGTPLYVGPQILKGKQYDQKIDIWSLGVMMYEMLVGQNPFKISRQQDLVKIIKDQIKIPTYVEISKQGKDFLFSCLQKNPEKRCSIRELLNHQFFKKYPDKNDKKLGI